MIKLLLLTGLLIKLCVALQTNRFQVNCNQKFPDASIVKEISLTSDHDSIRNNACYLNGLTSSFSSSLNLNKADTELSVLYWMKPSRSAVGPVRVFSVLSEEGDLGLICYQEGEDIYFSEFEGEKRMESSRFKIPLNEWSSVSFFKSAARSTVLINGELTRYESVALSLGSSIVSVGSSDSSTASSSYQGGFDDLEISNENRFDEVVEALLADSHHQQDLHSQRRLHEDSANNSATSCGCGGRGDISIVIGDVGAYATVNIYVSDSAINGSSSTQSPSDCSSSPAPYPTMPPVNVPISYPTSMPIPFTVVPTMPPTLLPVSDITYGMYTKFNVSGLPIALTFNGPIENPNYLIWRLDNDSFLYSLITYDVNYLDSRYAMYTILNPDDFKTITMSPSGVLYGNKGSNQICTLESDDNGHWIETIVAGNGVNANEGDNGPAVEASLFSIDGMYVSEGNEIFITSVESNVVRKVGWSGVITRFAGVYNSSEVMSGGFANHTAISMPRGITGDSSSGNNNVYFTTSDGIMKVDNDYRISKLVGTDDAHYDVKYYNGYLFYAVQKYYLDVEIGFIHQYEIATGVIRRVAGSENFPSYRSIGHATEFGLGVVGSIAVSTGGDIYFVDTYFNQLRHLFPVVNDTFVQSTYFDVTRLNDSIYYSGLATDSNGTIYLRSSEGNYYSYDGTETALVYSDEANDRDRMFISDSGIMYFNTGPSRISKLDLFNGNVTVVAGTGYSRPYDAIIDEGAPATSTPIHWGWRTLDIFVDSLGEIYFTDRYLVRRIDVNGIINRYAGTGVSGSNSEGVATSVDIAKTYAITGDPAGNIYYSHQYGFSKIDVDTKLLTNIPNIEGSYFLKYYDDCLYYILNRNSYFVYIFEYSLTANSERIVASKDGGYALRLEDTALATSFWIVSFNTFTISSDGDIYYGLSMGENVGDWHHIFHLKRIRKI